MSLFLYIYYYKEIVLCVQMNELNRCRKHVAVQKMADCVEVAAFVQSFPELVSNHNQTSNDLMTSTLFLAPMSVRVLTSYF